MKFAFMIMGDFDSTTDIASIHDGDTILQGVSTIEEACLVAQKLQKEGIDCIELCGAFEAEGAKKIIEATNHEIPIGYVVHLPEQDQLFQKIFS